jgi:cytochrome c5
MKNWKFVLPGFFLLAALPVLSQQGNGNSTQSNGAQQTRTGKVIILQQDDGERKFEQNCSRCHNAPENLSPRVTKAVLRHMRVRALLSKQDEEDILHYLRP